jgi:stearoyl-CoA desaturase (Delta-9 desaturase)
MPLDTCQTCPPDDTCPPGPRASLGVRLVTLVAVLLPLAGLVMAIVLLWGVPFHWTYLAIFGTMYLLTALGIGVGYHRLFTHKSFETGPVMRFIWAVLGSMAVEGPVIRWVATHRKHHQHADMPGDPHSPHAYTHDDHEHAVGIGGLLKGIWHAHVGWLFMQTPPDLDRYVPDLLKDPVVRFVDRTFVLWLVLGLIIPAALGGILTGTWMGVLLGFLWGGLARVLLVHHVTWSINSVCHLWGTRPFKTRDESRDNPLFGILAFGEGWHNTHHAFPASARHGLAWWKLDINYLVIRAMAMLRLARNVRLPSPERIVERRRLHGA